MAEKENQYIDFFYKNYRREYDIVATSWRFFISLRFIVIAFTITLQSALFTLYSSKFPPEQTSNMFRFYYIFIPLLGVFTVFATSIIEKRNIAHFRLLVKRGIELEIFLGLIGGHFQLINELQTTRQRGRKRFYTHTWGITIIYFTLYIIWILLFLNAVLN